MAEIFQEVFGPKLVKENLVDKDNLDRLPSPQQLQGMIILKGTEKEKKDRRTLTVRRHTYKHTKLINCCYVVISDNNSPDQ